MPKISIVIPCYFNAVNIPDLAEALIQNESLFEPDVEFEYVLIDDDSQDWTWQKIKDFKTAFPNKVTGIKLNRNVGSYNAIIPGLQQASGDCAVVMAADLQDPPAHVITMYKEWKDGHKLVLANRQSSSFLLNQYFNFLRTFGLENLPPRGFDFCLFDKEMKDSLVQFDARGANSLYSLLTLGPEPKLAPYMKEKRKTGRSRWTIWKKVKLALNTIERYSKFRLVHVSLLCLTISAISLSLFKALGSGAILIVLMVFFMIAALFIEILRTLIRGTQQDLTNIVEEVI